MADFLLIHRSCHGAWCWRDVVPPLKARGHAVRALDLPGHGDDQTPPEEITSDTFVHTILGAAGPRTVLVGHSLGGMWITLAAEADPGRFARLVYVAAWVARDGISTDDLGNACELDDVGNAMIRNGATFTFSSESHDRIFYPDCPADTTAFARVQFRPEPTAPLAKAFHLTTRQFKIPSSYVRCTQDRAILDRVQAELTRDWPAEDVHTMTCGHLPFFADPAGVAGILDGIARG